MKWQGRNRSSNFEDRRGSSPRIGGAKFGAGSILVLVLVFFLSGGDLSQVLNVGMNMAGSRIESRYKEGENYEASKEEEELKDFSLVVLKDLEDLWTDKLHDEGLSLNPSKLVVYSGNVESGCGFAQSGTGPFYCGADQKIYVDLSFYEELKNKFNASGDFAFAYVLAHEYGHHIQKELGILDKVHQMRSKLSEKEYNELSVRLELQADYFAGVFASYVKGKGYMEKGDIEEAMKAASAVGDDTIQKNSRGYVDPDSFTHGSSKQRVKWFMKGFEKASIRDGDAFSIDNP